MTTSNTRRKRLPRTKLLESDWAAILQTPSEAAIPCSCNRSPTGMCIGWHGLTEAQAAAKLKAVRNQLFGK